MKRLMLIFSLLLCVLSTPAQESFYQERLAEFAKMRPVDSTDVVMLGDGFTELAGDWNVLLRWQHVRNRGISGDNVTSVSSRLNSIMAGRPKAVFLMVGARDIVDGMQPSELLQRYGLLLRNMQKMSPHTRIFVQSVLPVNESYGKAELKGKMTVVAQFDRSLRLYCEKHKIAYINLFRSFVRHGTNELRRELTQDGFKLSPFGYKVWAFEIKKYLIDL